MKQRSKSGMELGESKEKGNPGRRRRVSRFLLGLAVITLILNAFVVMSATLAAAEGSPPTVWTDKDDY